MQMLGQTLFGLLSLEQDDLVGLVVQVVLQMLEHPLVLWLGSWRSLPEKDGDGPKIFYQLIKPSEYIPDKLIAKNSIMVLTC